MEWEYLVVFVIFIAAAIYYVLVLLAPHQRKDRSADKSQESGTLTASNGAAKSAVPPVTSAPEPEQGAHRPPEVPVPVGLTTQGQQIWVSSWQAGLEANPDGISTEGLNDTQERVWANWSVRQAVPGLLRAWVPEDSATRQDMRAVADYLEGMPAIQDQRAAGHAVLSLRAATTIARQEFGPRQATALAAFVVLGLIPPVELRTGDPSGAVKLKLAEVDHYARTGQQSSRAGQPTPRRDVADNLRQMVCEELLDPGTGAAQQLATSFKLAAEAS